MWRCRACPISREISAHLRHGILRQHRVMFGVDRDGVYLVGEVMLPKGRALPPRDSCPLLRVKRGEDRTAACEAADLRGRKQACVVHHDAREIVELLQREDAEDMALCARHDLYRGSIEVVRIFRQHQSRAEGDIAPESIGTRIIRYSLKRHWIAVEQQEAVHFAAFLLQPCRKAVRQNTAERPAGEGAGLVAADDRAEIVIGFRNDVLEALRQGRVASRDAAGWTA